MIYLKSFSLFEGRLLEDKEFKRWFNGSKVVDRNGEPLLVYHGSKTKIRKFNDGKLNNGTIYFTADYDNADGYGNGNYVYDVYLSIKNPLVIDAKGKKWDDLETPYGTSTREVVDNLDTTKYDGVIFNNIKDSWIDDAEYQDPSTVYVAIKSSQIRQQ